MHFVFVAYIAFVSLEISKLPTKLSSPIVHKKLLADVFSIPAHAPYASYAALRRDKKNKEKTIGKCIGKNYGQEINQFMIGNRDLEVISSHETASGMC